MEPKQHSLKGLTLTFSSFENEIDTVAAAAAAAAIDTYLSVLNVQHWAENISNLFTPFTSHFSVTVRRLHSLTLSHTHTQKEREKERLKWTHTERVCVCGSEKKREREWIRASDCQSDSFQREISVKLFSSHCSRNLRLKYQVFSLYEAHWIPF